MSPRRATRFDGKVRLTYRCSVPPAPAPVCVTAKKKCCRDKPRCKRCPVTLSRLEKAGYAERVDDRVFLVVPKVPKKVREAARKR